jgi:succinate dehydrogenase / fumarate reductase cytochrome b subunit
MSETTRTQVRFGTTVAQEFLVALSGFILVLFILGHLAGNFLLFRGPEAFNAYARGMQSMGPLLWLARLILLTALLVHVVLTIRLKLLGRSARGGEYAVKKYMGNTTLAKLTMLYTGIAIFLFLVLHIYDFTLRSQTGPATEVGGVGLGVYGLVWNSFSDPVHALVYILAVWAVGLHFSNAVSSIWVTLGLLSESATARANRAAQILGIFVALGFSSIPVFVLANTYLIGV